MDNGVYFPKSWYVPDMTQQLNLSMMTVLHNPVPDMSPSGWNHGTHSGLQAHIRRDAPAIYFCVYCLKAVLTSACGNLPLLFYAVTFTG
jgi:hypothetical protein